MSSPPSTGAQPCHQRRPPPTLLIHAPAPRIHRLWRRWERGLRETPRGWEAPAAPSGLRAGPAPPRPPLSCFLPCHPQPASIPQARARGQPHSPSFQDVLDRRRWKRQLLMRRVAALCMYTEFFMMTGILASSSALRMHSSKNPAAPVPLHPPLLPAPPLPSPPQDPGGVEKEIRRPHPLGDQRPLPTGVELQAFRPPQIQEPKAATPRRSLRAGLWRGASISTSGSPSAQQALCGSPGPGPLGRALGLGQHQGQGLLFRWLTSARILSSFSLFRTLELSPCSRLRKAPSASRRRLSRSMRTFTSA